MARAQGGRTVDLAVGAFGLLLLVAIFMAIGLSLVQAPFGSVIFGSTTVWRGHTAAFRAIALDADGFTQRPVDRARFAWRDDRGPREPVEAGVGEVAEVTLAVPDDLDGFAWLDVTLQRGTDEDTVRMPVRVLETPGTPAGVLVPWEAELDPKVPLRPSEVSAAAYPLARVLVDGLENDVALQVRRGGRPWQGPVRVEPPGVDAAADAAGWLRVRYRPPAGNRALRISLGADPNLATTLPLQPKATQLRLDVSPGPIALDSEPLRAHVQALPFRDSVYIDLWVGQALVAATSAPLEQGARDVTLPLPKGYRGFVQVVAYRNLQAARDTQLAALRWVQPAGDRSQADAALLAALAALPGGGARQAADLPAEVAVSRFVPDFDGMPVIAATGEERQAAFDRERARLQGQIQHYFLATLALGAVAVTVWLTRHQVRTRRAVGAVVREALEARESMDPTFLRDVGRIGHVYNLILALAALFLASYGIFAVIGKMRWVRW
jgi:hypothetical protein